MKFKNIGKGLQNEIHRGHVVIMDNDPVGRLEKDVFLLCLVDFGEGLKTKGFAHQDNYTGTMVILPSVCSRATMITGG